MNEPQQPFSYAPLRYAHDPSLGDFLSVGVVLACVRPDHKRAGVRCPYFRDNVAWWQNHLTTLRQTPFYRAPPRNAPTRQLELFDDEFQNAF